MILNSLNDLYSRLASDPDYEIAKPGYSPQNISFRVVLKPDGSLFAIQDARIKDDKGKLRADKVLVYGDGKRSGQTPKPFITWDNALYLLGLPPAKEIKERGETEAWKWAQERFQASKDAHIEFAKISQTKYAKCVAKFFEEWKPEDCFKYSDLKEFAVNFGTFSIQGELKDFCCDKPSLETLAKNEDEASTEVIGQCLLTGSTNAYITRLHPIIKGVTAPKGKQQKNGPLVSMDKGSPAFNSYGKTQGYNAPVSEKAAFQYGTALNALLSGRQSNKHRIRIGDTTCVFWTDQPSVFEDTFGLISSEGSNASEKAQDDATRSKLETFLKALRLGGNAETELADNPDETKFYLLGLAPNAARLSVRFFHQSTVAELLTNLRAHLHDIEIVREWETTKGKRLEDPEFPAYWQLLTQTARVSDETPPLLGGALMRAILENTPYPEALFSAVIRRIRADREINYLRAAIIKGTLTRNRNHKLTKPITAMLDTENTDPAYLLGRLFAALEKTQQDALGDRNAGLRDKFYSSASATPASVFPRILRTYQHHLEKVPSGKLAEKIGSEKARKAKIGRERLIQEILSGIPSSGFPHNFNLKSQGIFALGYYHQRKDFFTKKSEG